MSSLVGVKVGDYLKCKIRYSSANLLFRVARLTATRAVCKCGAAFKLEDGLRIGTGDGFGRTYASIATAEEAERINVEVRVREAQTELGKFRVTADNLEAVEALLKAGK